MSVIFRAQRFGVRCVPAALYPSAVSDARPPGSARLAWLDLFRGACVVGMIETHVLNTFLDEAQRSMAWFVWLNYFNGLIAPAFLFIAGYAQGLGMRRAEGVRSGFWRKFRRLGEVWLLGYALHFPGPQLLAGQWSEAVRLGTQVDVLQCLGVSLAVLLLCECWARRWVDSLAKVLGALAVFGTAAAAAWHFEPHWLLGYFNLTTGSLFPLLPWAAFVCAGFVASRAQRWFSWESLVNFALIVALAFLLSATPAFFAERLAELLIAVLVVQWIAARWQPRSLLFAGRESLILYAAHLVLIEVLAVAWLPRRGSGVVECAGIFCGVVGASVLIAVLWDRARRAGRRRESSAPAT